MKSWSVRRDRSKLRGGGGRDWHRGPDRNTDGLRTGLLSFRDRFRNKGVSFCEFVPVVARCPMTMQDPINMYKRERHDTSASVNADLYDSEGRKRRPPPVHYRCTTTRWRLESEQWQIFDCWILRSIKREFRLGYCYQQTFSRLMMLRCLISLLTVNSQRRNIICVNSWITSKRDSISEEVDGWFERYTKNECATIVNI